MELYVESLVQIVQRAVVPDNLIDDCGALRITHLRAQACPCVLFGE